MKSLIPCTILPILTVFLLVAFMPSPSMMVALHRSRNGTMVGNLWNLEEMAECRLGYGAMVYNDYGCWCGVGGAGEPVDGIDQCCMNHDHCYDYAVDVHDCRFGVPEEYVDWYDWTCNRTSPQSALGEPHCPEPSEEPQSKCQQVLCWCDRTVVDCWANYAKPALKATCPHPHQEASPTLDERRVNDDGKMRRDKSFVEALGEAWLYLPMALVKWVFR